MGLFALLGVVVGTILMTIGQFGLGLVGLTDFFPKMVEGVKVLNTFATKYGNKVIGIGFAYLGITNLLDKDKKDPFLGLAQLAISAGMMTKNKATAKIAGAFAVGLIGIEIVSNTLSGQALTFVEALELAFSAAFGASLIGFGLKGNLLTFSAVILFTWIIPNIPEFLEDIGLRQKARELGREMRKNINKFKKGEEPSPITWSSLNEENDFIWRPGQSPISINPNDNLIGFKGNNPMGGSIIINQTINADITDMKQFERMMAENNRDLVSKISSQHGIGA